MLGGVTCRAGTGLDRLGGDAAARACGRRLGDVRRARRRHAHRGRSRRRPLRRGGGRALAGRLERAVAARAARARARSARSARGRGLHRRGARARATGSPRRAGGSTPRPARPISATRAARSISTDPAFRGSGTVAALRRRRRRFTASGLDAFADGWFTAGKLTLHQRRQCRLRGRGEEPPHRRATASLIELWQAMPEPIAAGDAFTVTAGCDKRFATCRDRFDNVVEFPRLPAHPRQRLRHQLSGAGRAGQRRREPAELTPWPFARAQPSSPRRAPGSARPIGTRPRSRASAAIASGSCAASGARCIGDEPERGAALCARLGRGERRRGAGAGGARGI